VSITDFSSTARNTATQSPVLNQAGRIEAASVKLAAKTAPVRPARSGNIEMVFGAAPASIYCRPLMVCIVRLEAGELVSDTISLGDDVRWDAKTRAFGPGGKTHLVEIKRDDDSEPSSLTFGTNKGRIYSVELIPSPDIHTPILSFIYPDTIEAERRAKIAADHARIAADEAATAAATEKAKREAAAARAAALKATGKPTSGGFKPAGALDHDYRITGSAKFKPQTIYNDGRKTYVVLPRRYRGDIPIVTAGSGGGTLSGRFDPATRTLTIDRVPDTFSLAVGRKKIKVSRL
jgi:type IV secretion system protein VirB9